MRDVFAAGGHQLEGEALAIVRIILTDPTQTLGGNLEFLFVEVDDIAAERGLAENPVHKPAGFLLIEVERGVTVFPIEREVVFPQRLAGGIHQQGSLVVEIDVVLDLVLLAELEPGGAPLLLDLDAGLVDGRHQAEGDGEGVVLRRSFVDLLDAVIPRCDFPFLLPVRHLFLHVTEIGDHVHELGVGELLLVKRVGDVIPELEDVAGRDRPQFQRFVGRDFPTRADPHHVVVVQLAFNHVAAVTFLNLGDEIRLLVVEFAIEFLLDDVEHRRVVELVGRLRQVLAAMHAFHHGRILAGAGDEFVFRGAGAEPAVSLEAQAGAERAGFVLHPPLDEKVVAENLGDGTVFLQHFAAFPRFLGETVQKIESGSVRVHRVWR